LGIKWCGAFPKLLATVKIQVIPRSCFIKSHAILGPDPSIPLCTGIHTPHLREPFHIEGFDARIRRGVALKAPQILVGSGWIQPCPA